MIEIDEKAFIAALNHVAATDEGKVVLACFKEYCRFDGDVLAMGSLENTYANAHMRRAYLFFRNHIRVEHLKKIEFDYKRKVENGTTTATDTKPARKPRAARK
jgi:hypothetical protein